MGDNLLPEPFLMTENDAKFSFLLCLAQFLTYSKIGHCAIPDIVVYGQLQHP